MDTQQLTTLCKISNANLDGIRARIVVGCRLSAEEAHRRAMTFPRNEAVAFMDGYNDRNNAQYANIAQSIDAEIGE